MAPSKTSGSTSSKKTRSSSLKQGTLSFASKRTSAAHVAKGKQPVRAASATASSKPATPVSSDIGNTSSESINSSDVSIGDDAVIKDLPSVSLRKAKSADRKAMALKSRDSMENSTAAKDSNAHPMLDLKDKAAKWNQHYRVVREKMGHMPPVHAQGQTKIHEILRVFDLSYIYGPCVGITRLQRWERAEALGLNPPQEVREILLTKEALEQEQFSQSVFYDEV